MDVDDRCDFMWLMLQSRKLRCLSTLFLPNSATRRQSFPLKWSLFRGHVNSEGGVNWYILVGSTNIVVEWRMGPRRCLCYVSE